MRYLLALLALAVAIGCMTGCGNTPGAGGYVFTEKVLDHQEPPADNSEPVYDGDGSLIGWNTPTTAEDVVDEVAWWVDALVTVLIGAGVLTAGTGAGAAVLGGVKAWKNRR